MFFSDKRTQVEKLEDALQEISKYFADSRYERFEKEREDALFSDLIGIDNVEEYLKSTLSGDIYRYFNAANDEARQLAKGAFLRTAYLYDRIRKSKPKSLTNSK